MQSASALASDLFAGILDLIFPLHCLQCKEFGADVLCQRCLAELATPVPQPYCLRCGQLLPGKICTKCTDYPAGLVRCRAVGTYDGKLADSIHQLKYRDRPMLADPLARLMADYLTIRAEIMNNLEFDAIVPVPLHRSRERRRGYNQSERLARSLGKILGIRTESRALTRHKNTKSQVGKQRDERLRNLKNAFRANSQRCQGKTFLLIDDVSTTGSTINECSKCLLQAGANKVYSITLALG